MLREALVSLSRLATQETADSEAAASAVQERAARVVELIERIAPALAATGALG